MQELLDHVAWLRGEGKGKKFCLKNLRSADLRKADLRGADLQSADLQSADLRSARLGHRRTRGILEGQVHVFPKLDGTNGVVWRDSDGSTVRFGSRNKELADGQDNHGFRAAMSQPEVLEWWRRAFDLLPAGAVVYGEWLVPHTVKSYEHDAWRRFYVFDVLLSDGMYATPESYIPLLYAAGPQPTCVGVLNPLVFGSLTHEDLKTDSQGQISDTCDKYTTTPCTGEGVVLKNYAWMNADPQYRAWAKVVRTGFSSHRKSQLAGDSFEVALVNKFCDEHLVRKEYAKAVAAVLGPPEGYLSTVSEDDPILANRGKIIPRLLSEVTFSVWCDNARDILKRAKGKSIDTGALSALVRARVAAFLPDLFGDTNDK